MRAARDGSRGEARRLISCWQAEDRVGGSWTVTAASFLHLGAGQQETSQAWVWGDET